MPVWFVYIVSCCDNSLYTGVSNNLTKRVAAHNSKKGAKYTRSRVPVSLVYSEEYETQSAALRREHQIKKLSRTQKIELIGKN